MEWNNPWFLLLLIGIPLLIWNFRNSSHKHNSYLIYPDLKNIKTQSTWKLKLLNWLPYFFYIALIFLIVAMARPQYILREEKIEAEGIDIFLVLDLSSSMLSKDFEPNRLEVSKKLAIEFLDKRYYDRIGIVGFAGEGFTQCPLTVDHTILNNLVQDLECGYLEDGTAIGLGLATAINRLKEDSLTQSKVIILLTDGVNNAGDVSPSLAAELAQTYKIKIYSIGVGSNGEAYSPIGRNQNGEYVFGMVPVNIDESLLNLISTSTGGKYYRATNKEQLKEIYQEIDRLEKNKINVKVFKRNSEEYRIFLWIGLLFFAAYFLLRIILQPLII
ncbi:MAG: VWA domain-containing protein [Saprospiraceae bacterium]|nr:VWA domain-containing protein [Saprospiraceae bacterium]